MKKLNPRAFILSLLIAVPAPALATDYVCKLSKKESGFIPDDLIIQHNTKTGAVAVLDQITQHFLGGQTKGNVATDNAKRTTYKWSVAGIDAGPYKNVEIRYRATIQKKSKKLTVTALPLGYTNTWGGRGACKVK